MSAIIQALWIEGELSPIEHLCLKSFIRNQHDVHLYHYGPIRNLPEGVQLKDAREIVSEEKVFKVQNSYASFSDLFRIQLLEKRGGYWVDTDVICLKPFDFEEEFVLGWQDEKLINGAVLKMKQGNPVTTDILQRYERPWSHLDLAVKYYLKEFKYSESRLKSFGNSLSADGLKMHYYRNATWGVMGGPTAITRLMEKHGMKNFAMDTQLFYPIHFTDWSGIFYDQTLPDKIDLSGSYAIHLWNNCFSEYKYFDKRAPFQKYTLIHQLAERYK